MKKIFYLIILGLFVFIPKSVFAEFHNVDIAYFLAIKSDGTDNAFYANLNNSSSATFTLDSTFYHGVSFVGNYLDFIDSDSVYDLSFSFSVYYPLLHDMTTPENLFNGASNAIFKAETKDPNQDEQYVSYGCTYTFTKDNPSINYANYQVTCPSVKIYKNFNWFNFTIMYGGLSSNSFTPYIWYKNVNFVKKSDNEIVNGLDDIKKEQEKTNEKLDGINDTMNDSNIDMDGANSFFGDFSDTDHGGISGVITAPLRFINKLTGTCSPISLDVLGTDVELPCGDTLFWNKPEVASFRVIWNVLFGGAMLYMLLSKLFKVIEGLKNPDDSRIEVMKL